MNCAQCGRVLAANAVYCSQCGAKVAGFPPIRPEPILAPPASPTAPGAGPRPSSTSSLALASIIFGALSWITLPIVGAIAAVVTGHLAKNEIDRSGRQLGGRELAIVGLVLGYVQLGLVVLGAMILLSILILGIRLSGFSL